MKTLKWTQEIVALNRFIKKKSWNEAIESKEINVI
jgi:hypothetical protein